jgi:hypothetical protein
MHRPDNMPSIMFVDIIDIFLAAKGCTTQDNKPSIMFVDIIDFFLAAKGCTTQASYIHMFCAGMVNRQCQK